MDIIKALMWRYATKRMMKKTIPNDKLNTIIKAIHLAPSGIGLQPYVVFIISDQDLKEKILPIAMNQVQIVECSHLLIFAAWDEYSDERIDKAFDYLNEERGGTTTISDNQRNFAKKFFAEQSIEENFHHAAKQAYIAFGLAIGAAALEGIDASPMEGFDPSELDKLLNLPSKGLKSSMLLALGYRDAENDWNLKLDKVRKPSEELIIEL